MMFSLEERLLKALQGNASQVQQVLSALHDWLRDQEALRVAAGRPTDADVVTALRLQIIAESQLAILPTKGA